MGTRDDPTSPMPASFKPVNLRQRFAVASFLTILGIALGLGWLFSHMLTQRMLHREGEMTMDFVQNLLNTDRSANFFANPKDILLRERFLASMEHVTSMREPVRANAYRPDGTVLWSTDPAMIGKNYPFNDELDEALSGRLVVHGGKLSTNALEKEEHVGLSSSGHYFVESYIPVTDHDTGKVIGVMEFYKIPEALNQAIKDSLTELWLACWASTTVLFLTLYWIVARADKLLRQQQAQINEAQTLSTAVELAGAVAHNLRNPLASIRMSAEMLSQQPHEAPEHTSDITAAVDRADRWITELVRVSQAPHLLEEAVGLEALTANCLNEMAPEMQRRGVRWQAPVAGHSEVQAHPDMLRQIVLSLIANAIEAMPDGGELDVQVTEEGSFHRLHIADTGTGITEDTSRRLFRPFFSTKSGGLGIGLALVKRMVTQWHGDIQLRPRATRGTIVEIRLPRAH